MELRVVNFSREKRRMHRKNTVALIALVFVVVGSFTGTQHVLRSKGEIVQTSPDKKKSITSDQATILAEETKPKDDNPVKGTNVTVLGDKLTYDAQEIQNVLKDSKEQIDGKKIAFLTFDDGPSTTVTPRILEILKDNNVKATFFVVGSSIEKSEKAKELLKEEYEQGHAIGNHTYSHRYDILYPRRTVSIPNFMNEIDRNVSLMKSVLGNDFNTRVIRFPGGHASWRGVNEMDKVFKEKGYCYIDWNVLNGDSEPGKKDKDSLVNRLKETDRRQDRLVVLMHDTYGKETTAEALPEVIKYLKEQGYDFRTLK